MKRRDVRRLLGRVVARIGRRFRTKGPVLQSVHGIWKRLERDGDGRFLTAEAILSDPGLGRTAPDLTSYTARDLSAADIAPDAAEAVRPGPDVETTPFEGTAVNLLEFQAAVGTLRPMPIHRWQDVLFARGHGRFLVMRGSEVDGRSMALPGPGLAQAAKRAPQVEAMVYAGDGFDPRNPAHALFDQLARAVLLRDIHRVPSAQIFLPAPAAPVVEAVRGALDPDFGLVPLGAVWHVGDLRMHGTSLGWVSSGHPMRRLDPRISGPIAAAAARAAGEGRGRGARIYLSRRAVRDRRLLNEAALIDALAARGFAALDMGTLSGPDQLATIRDAEVVVAPHGAALSSLIAARPGLRCVEVFNPAVGTLTFRAVAAACGVDHRAVFGRAATTEEIAAASAVGDPPRAPWIVDIADVLATLDAA